MDIDELIKRFLEETDYQNKDDIMLLMAHGSRVSGTAHENSDLDILYVTSNNKKYKSVQLVDGIPIDITILPLNDAEQMIEESKLTGSNYLESVLKTGIVIIDRYDTYNNLYSLLDFKRNGKRIVDGEMLDLAESHFLDFDAKVGNVHVHYYTTLELLRKLYHAKSNCSNISAQKVYDLYSNRKKAKEQYMVKLPDEQFIQDYLTALQETDYEKRRGWLVKFLELFENQNVKRNRKSSFCSDSEIPKKLVIINNAIWKCEDMLLQKSPYSKPLYYILVGEILYLYEMLNNKSLECDIDFLDSEQMIRNLEYLFCLTDSKHEIDYYDYMIRW